MSTTRHILFRWYGILYVAILNRFLTNVFRYKFGFISYLYCVSIKNRLTRITTHTIMVYNQIILANNEHVIIELYKKKMCLMRFQFICKFVFATLSGKGARIILLFVHSVTDLRAMYFLYYLQSQRSIISLKNKKNRNYFIVIPRFVMP